jgi:hypothetical protein
MTTLWDSSTWRDARIARLSRDRRGPWAAHPAFGPFGACAWGVAGLWYCHHQRQCRR